MFDGLAGVVLGIALAGSIVGWIAVGRRVSKKSDREKRQELLALDGRRVTVALGSGGKVWASVNHTGTLFVGSSPWSVTLVEDKPRVIPLAQVMWVVDVETGQRIIGPRWGSARPRPVREPDRWVVVTLFCVLWIATFAAIILIAVERNAPTPLILVPYLLLPLAAVVIGLRRRANR